MTKSRFVAVLGESDFHRRSGFRSASDCGLDNEYGVDEAFMVLPLKKYGLPLEDGLVKYADESANLETDGSDVNGDPAGKDQKSH